MADWHPVLQEDSYPAQGDERVLATRRLKAIGDKLVVAKSLQAEKREKREELGKRYDEALAAEKEQNVAVSDLEKQYDQEILAYARAIK